jgi:ubiquinone/menaquinone biosynthesis C-methylase UbiE
MPNTALPETSAGGHATSYDKNAEFWVEIIRDKRDRYRTDLTNPAMIEAIGSVDDLRVLDAGCGEGYLARELAARGAASVLGVDSSAKLIAAANELVFPERTSLAFRVGDVADLQLGDNAVDLVVCNHVLNDLQEPVTPIRECSRVLAPAGRIAILMLHPCFYGDRASRNDSANRTTAEAYFQPRSISQPFVVDGVTSPAEVTSWHRPLEFYIQALRDAGLWLTDLREPHPSEQQLASDPWWRANFSRPLFLLLVAQKHAAISAARPTR